MIVPALLCAISSTGIASAAEPAAASVQRPPLIATADFATRPLISRPRLSPNGEWLVAMIRKAGKEQLGIVAVKTNEIRLLGMPKGMDLVSYRWAGNGKVLISVGKKTPWLDGDEIYTTRLLAYDIAAREGKFVGKVADSFATFLKPKAGKAASPKPKTTKRPARKAAAKPPVKSLVRPRSKAA
jgi:hypothetical protein